MTNVSERVALFIHVADENDRCRTMIPEMRRKVDAVIRVRGKHLELLESKAHHDKQIHDVIAAVPPNPNIPQLKKAMDESAKELVEYKEASTVIIPWLERTDPELYNAAKIMLPTKHYFCNCHSGKRLQEMRNEDLAWIGSLKVSSAPAQETRKRARK